MKETLRNMGGKASALIKKVEGPHWDYKDPKEGSSAAGIGWGALLLGGALVVGANQAEQDTVQKQRADRIEQTHRDVANVFDVPPALPVPPAPASSGAIPAVSSSSQKPPNTTLLADSKN